MDAHQNDRVLSARIARRIAQAMIAHRNLRREEIAQVWSIDRSEVVEKVYCVENEALVLKPEHHDVTGWPPGEAEKYTPILLDCFDRGGWFHGAFDDARLIGVAVLESKRIGKHNNQLQLKFLHVSRSYRNTGLGTMLFEMSRATAREKGCTQLYVSATPSEHTVNFYTGLGCVLARHPEPDLFQLEPEDIHLECDV